MQMFTDERGRITKCSYSPDEAFVPVDIINELIRCFNEALEKNILPERRCYTCREVTEPVPTEKAQEPGGAEETALRMERALRAILNHSDGGEDGNTPVCDSMRRIAATALHIKLSEEE